MSRRGQRADEAVSRSARGIAEAAVTGAITGMLAWFGADQLNLGAFLPPQLGGYFFLCSGAIAAVVACTRFRLLVWMASGILCLVTIVVSCTGIMVGPVNALVQTDRLARADAIVMLSSGVHEDGTLDPHGQDRLIRALELAHAGWAPRIVITRIPPPFRSERPGVERQMAALGTGFPIDEIGPVHNTHDEALAVETLMRGRGWRQVIVVTSPLHTRRARAVFLKAGVPAIVAAAHESEFDLPTLPSPYDRMAAFRQWVREMAGWQTYRARGWV